MHALQERNEQGFDEDRNGKEDFSSGDEESVDRLRRGPRANCGHGQVSRLLYSFWAPSSGGPGLILI